ncbi:hypothetical protein C8J57DRAFT_1227011 [Mycena rebaudengoi]|nr:hypothetical protein C8J57DRAFT_1227011 [Mycena rebaudengoi]
MENADLETVNMAYAIAMSVLILRVNSRLRLTSPSSLQLASQMLIWQVNYFAIWHELGCKPVATDPSLDELTRRLLLAGRTLEDAWEAAQDLNRPQALMALVLAIDESPVPEDSPYLLLPDLPEVPMHLRSHHDAPDCRFCDSHLFCIADFLFFWQDAP